jgi:hypothetical protein
METSERPSYACPDISLPMSEKRKPSYGAQYAKHIWGNYWNNGPMLGLRKYGRYMYLRNVARGGQNLDSVKGYLNYGGEENQGFTYFDLGVLNFITVIIRKGKNELRKVDYDIMVDAIDPFSLSEKRQFEENARMVMALRDVIGTYGKAYQELMPEFPEGWKPSSSQELEVFLQANNYKIKDEIKAEISINSDLKWENWAQVRNLMFDDWFDLGAAFCRAYIDHNGRRRVRYVPLERFVCSTPSDESFTNLTYAGEVRYISEEEFRNETASYYTKAQQDEIVTQWSGYNNYGQYDSDGNWVNYNTNDGVRRFAVLDFEFVAPDMKVWSRRFDKKGKLHWDEKSDDYEVGYYKDPTGKRVFDQKLYDDEQRKIQSGEKEIVTDSRMSCYGGSWIIGSDHCYNYKLLESDKYVSVGYVGFAPELHNGTTTSTVEQLLEPAAMVQIAHNKMKEVYGQGWIGFLKIDHSKLVDVALGKAGQNWTPRQVLNFFLQKKIIVHNEELKGSSGSAFEVKESGITMEDYSKTLWDAVQQMTTITGIDPRIQTGTNISAESMKQQNEATQGALGFLYHSYQQVYGAVGKLLLRFTPEFRGQWSYMRQFIVGAVRTTTAEEWNNLKMRINKYASQPLDQGGLTASDEAILDNIRNLKLAQFVLAYLVKRNMEQAQSRKQEDMKLQGQINDQNAQNAMQLKIQEMSAQLDADLRLEEFKHKAKMEEIMLQNQGLVHQKQLQMEGMYQIARQQGTDSIIKESQRSQSNAEVTAMKNANDRILESAVMYHDHSIHESEKIHDKEIEEIKAKNKPKAATK